MKARLMLCQAKRSAKIEQRRSVNKFEIVLGVGFLISRLRIAHNMLVVSCIHVGAQFVCGLPEFVIQFVQELLLSVVHENPLR
jgi:hypothetical protein